MPSTTCIPRNYAAQKTSEINLRWNMKKLQKPTNKQQNAFTTKTTVTQLRADLLHDLKTLPSSKYNFLHTTMYMSI